MVIIANLMLILGVIVLTLKDEPMVGPKVWNSFCCIWKCNNNVNATTKTFKNFCKQTAFGRNCIYFQDWLLELLNQATSIRSNGRRYGPPEPITYLFNKCFFLLLFLNQNPFDFPAMGRPKVVSSFFKGYSVRYGSDLTVFLYK